MPIYPPTEVKQGGPTDLLAALGTANLVGRRTQKGLAAYAIGAAAIELGKKWVGEIRGRMTFTVSVKGDDDIYREVQAYLLEILPESKRRGLTARTMQRRDGKLADARGMEVVPSGASVTRSSLEFLYDAKTSQAIRVDGHRVDVHMARDDPFSTDHDDRQNYWALERIVFTAYSEAGRDAVMSMLQKVSARREHRVPEFYIAGRWGGWDSRTDLPRREASTVVLPAGQKERLFDDVERFLNEEHHYTRLGIPYHRGYLLYGPPGTGKTSIVKAMGTHFGLDVYYIPLGDLAADTSLLHLVSNVRPRSILLLEDVDVFKAAHSRTETEGDTKDSVTLSGLLNTLDGVATPHGLIKVLTTNDRSSFDDALIRAGRVDIEEHVSYVNDDQVRRLFEMFYGLDGAALPPIGDHEVAPSDVIEVMKRNFTEPAMAVAELEMLLVGSDA